MHRQELAPLESVDDSAAIQLEGWLGDMAICSWPNFRTALENIDLGTVRRG